MTPASEPTFRVLGPTERPSAARLAERAGAHGVYVRNSLAAEGEGGTLLGVFDAGVLAGFGWFGSRGNLIVVADTRFDAVAVARAMRNHPGDWRICLGPQPVVRAIAAAEPIVPLVDREQVYYGVAPGAVAVGRASDLVRPALRADIGALVEASIDLNRSDLNVAPWRVHRGWLKDSVKRRIRDGATFVIGPVGAPTCKLDIGSRGPAGCVLEGVHTVPEARGRGQATMLVATVARDLLARSALVCLHVAAGNFAARRAYEAAGMRPLGTSWILLRG